MHPELEKLINLTLTDLIITDKERNVIYAKANQLGVTTDEVDVYIEAKQQMLRKQHGPSKCPACGNLLSGLTKTCVCGYILDTGKPQDDYTLEGVIEKLENLLIEITSIQGKKADQQIEGLSARIEKEIRYIETRYADNPNVRKLLRELKDKSSSQIRILRQNAKRKKVLLLLLFILCFGIIAFNALFKSPKKKVSIISIKQLFSQSA